jgi:hypothetical protein
MAILVAVMGAALADDTGRVKSTDETPSWDGRPFNADSLLGLKLD